MNKAAFSCVLSDDKSEMKLMAQTGEFRFSAAQVEDLALFFGQLRAQMSPGLAEQSGDVVALEGDRWEIYRKPQDGSARLYFRLPGLGWSFIHLEEDMAVSLSGLLNPKKLIPRTPQNQ